MKKCLIVRGVSLLLVCSTVCIANAAEKGSDRSISQKQIDVGGYALNFRYAPGVLPAIVFEAGGGMTSSQWRRIQKEVTGSLKNATVSYDRAGHGRSEPTNKDYDIEREVAALRAGLEALGVAEEVILIGHSYGAFLIQLYADTYPGTVQSMLYIDPNTTLFIKSKEEAEVMAEAFDASLVPDNNFGRALTKQMQAFPKTVERMLDVPLASCPCTVIAAEERWWPTDAENDNFRLSHEALARQCGTELIIAEGSGHNVPREAQDLVVSTIRDMVTR